MKLVLVEYKEDPNEDYKMSVEYVLELDGKFLYSMSFQDGEPEDNNLNRNFSAVLTIPRLASLIAEHVGAGAEFSVEKRAWGTQWD